MGAITEDELDELIRELGIEPKPDADSTQMRNDIGALIAAAKRGDPRPAKRSKQKAEAGFYVQLREAAKVLATALADERRPLIEFDQAWPLKDSDLIIESDGARYIIADEPVPVTAPWTQRKRILDRLKQEGRLAYERTATLDRVAYDGFLRARGLAPCPPSALFEDLAENLAPFADTQTDNPYAGRLPWLDELICISMRGVFEAYFKKAAKTGTYTAGRGHDLMTGTFVAFAVWILRKGGMKRRPDYVKNILEGAAWVSQGEKVSEKKRARVLAKREKSWRKN